MIIIAVIEWLLVVINTVVWGISGGNTEITSPSHIAMPILAMPRVLADKVSCEIWRLTGFASPIMRSSSLIICSVMPISLRSISSRNVPAGSATSHHLNGHGVAQPLDHPLNRRHGPLALMYPERITDRLPLCGFRPCFLPAVHRKRLPDRAETLPGISTDSTGHARHV